MKRTICKTINILTLKIVSWNLLFYLVLFSSVVCRMRISSTHMLTLIHTMNYPKKTGFNLYQSLHCAYITYSVKTWFFKTLSIAVGNHENHEFPVGRRQSEYIWAKSVHYTQRKHFLQIEGQVKSLYTEKF